MNKIMLSLLTLFICSGASAAGQFDATSASVDFGAIESSSKIMSVVFTNNTDAKGSLTNLSVSAPFKILLNRCVSVSKGKNCAVSVSLSSKGLAASPAPGNLVSGILSFGNSSSVNLEAHIIGAAPITAPSEFRFAQDTLEVNFSSSKEKSVIATLDVQNDSGMTSVPNLSVSDSRALLVLLNRCVTPLKAGKSCQYIVMVKQSQGQTVNSQVNVSFGSTLKDSMQIVAKSFSAPSATPTPIPATPTPEPVYSASWAAPTNLPSLSVCQGEASESYTLECRDESLALVDNSLCTSIPPKPADAVVKSPFGTRPYSIPNGSGIETCQEGSQQWVASNLQCSNPTHYTLNADSSACVINQYQLTIGSSLEGVISGASSGLKDALTEITLQANPFQGYSVGQWTGACTNGNANATCVILMDQAKSVSVSFVDVTPPTVTSAVVSAPLDHTFAEGVYTKFANASDVTATVDATDVTSPLLIHYSLSSTCANGNVDVHSLSYALNQQNNLYYQASDGANNKTACTFLKRIYHDNVAPNIPPTKNISKEYSTTLTSNLDLTMDYGVVAISQDMDMNFSKVLVYDTNHLGAASTPVNVNPTYLGNTITLPGVSVTGALSYGKSIPYAKIIDKAGNESLVQFPSYTTTSGLQSRCKDIYSISPYFVDKSSLYIITANSRVINAYCDMSSAGQGWTLVLRFPGESNPISISNSGVFTSPTQSTFAKLSDAEINTIRTSTGIYRAGCTGYTRYYNPQVWGTFTPRSSAEMRSWDNEARTVWVSPTTQQANGNNIHFGDRASGGTGGWWLQMNNSGSNSSFICNTGSADGGSGVITGAGLNGTIWVK